MLLVLLNPQELPVSNSVFHLTHSYVLTILHYTFPYQQLLVLIYHPYP